MATRKDAVAAEFFQGYISKAGEDDLLAALQSSTRAFKKLVGRLPRKKIDYAYAEGKWTIRELLQHIIDAERVFTYRALWFSRKDPSALPGFDENGWASHASATKRKWKDMVSEFQESRFASQHSFCSESLRRRTNGECGHRQRPPGKCSSIGIYYRGSFATSYKYYLRKIPVTGT